MTFEQVYNENAEKILNLAYRMTGKEEVARDLTQDIFLKVFKKQDSFKQQSKISTWVYSIALNHIINWIKREKKIIFFDFTNEFSNGWVAADKTLTYWEENQPIQADKDLEEHEKEIIVRKLIEELPAKYRLPFILFRYEEMSYQDIADHMHMSLSAVETRIHRAKKKLAEKLKPWEHII